MNTAILTTAVVLYVTSLHLGTEYRKDLEKWSSGNLVVDMKNCTTAKKTLEISAARLGRVVACEEVVIAEAVPPPPSRRKKQKQETATENEEKPEASAVPNPEPDPRKKKKKTEKKRNKDRKDKR